MPSRWQKIHDPASGSDYYYDSITGASQWEAPADYTAEEDASKADPVPAGGAGNDQDAQFIPAAKFEGSKPGYVFKKDKDGLGYYREAPAAEATPAVEQRNANVQDAPEKKGDWSKHYDENSKHYYWYNEKTGESKWVTEEPLPPMPGIGNAADGQAQSLAGPATVKETSDQHQATDVRAEQLGTDPNNNAPSGSGEAVVESVSNGAADANQNAAPAVVSSSAESVVGNKAEEKATGGVGVSVEENKVGVGGVSAENGVGLRSTREETAKMLASWLPAEVRNAPSIEYKNARQGDRGYDATATFGKDSGAFDHGSGKSYWERQGRPGDKAGRQMSYYYDLDALDKNRKEAQEKKKRLQEDKSIDWKAYAQKQKKKRFLARNQWLFED